MVEARLRPQGPYSLKLTTWTDEWSAHAPRGTLGGGASDPGRHRRRARFVRASSRRGAVRPRARRRHEPSSIARFARDPLLGRSVRTLRGLRPRRLATVAHAAVHAVCGQLIQSRRAREIERAVIRACGESPPSREALARLSPAKLTGCGLAPTRAATLARLVRTIDLEGLRARARDRAPRGSDASAGSGPWSVGVIALSGLGRYDAGLVGDLGLVKLLASRTGRWPERTGDRRAPRPVRRVARARERVPARRLQARARARCEPGPRAARTRPLARRERHRSRREPGRPLRTPSASRRARTDPQRGSGRRGDPRARRRRGAHHARARRARPSGGRRRQLRRDARPRPGRGDRRGRHRDARPRPALPGRRPREQLRQPPRRGGATRATRLLRPARRARRTGAPPGLPARLGAADGLVGARRRAPPAPPLRARRRRRDRRDGVRRRRRAARALLRVAPPRATTSWTPTCTPSASVDVASSTIAAPG